MGIESKLRPIYLLEILRSQTDEEHSLSTEDLRAILKELYGMEAHRVTITNDLEALRQGGFDVDMFKTSQNRYRYLHRDFDVAEIKMLVDAVQAFRVIPKHKEEQLVKKLTALAGIHRANEMKRTLLLDNSRKHDGDHIFYIVDRIYEAINKNKRIRFQMAEHDARKQRILRNGGEWYTFSPYSLVWNGDFYYMIGFSDKHNRIGSHRVDRIAEIPEILEGPGVPMPEDFDVNRYLNTMFAMYHVDPVSVELLCENSAMEAVLDKFGMDVPVFPYDGEHFLVRTQIAPNVSFYNWIFGFQGMVIIRGPNSIRKKFLEMLETMLSKVNGSSNSSSNGSPSGSPSTSGSAKPGFYQF